MQHLRSAMMVFAIISTSLLRANASGPSLGTADNFAVLAGSTVTNTGTTIITGDLGVSPGTSVTGFPPGVVTPPSAIFAGGPVAAQAEADALTGYNTLAATPVTANLTGQDLGGLTLLPGVYQFDTSAQLTGTLTIDGNGSPNSDFIFLIGSTLTTASNSSVVVIGGATPDNVFWQVGNSATLGANTAFQGNLLADQNITLNAGSTILDGRTLALNGAVILNSNQITIPTNASLPVPEPSQTAGMDLGVLAVAGMLLRKRWRTDRLLLSKI